MEIGTTELLLLNRQFGRYYAEQFEPLMEQTGLSINEVNVLLFLFNNPGMNTARDITELRGLGKSQVSQAVESLVTHGYLRRRVNERDRRVVHLSITEEGEPLASAARKIQAYAVNELLSELTEDEREQLTELIKKIASNVNSLVGKEH